MNIWNKLGFTENPYSPKPIAGDEKGECLLVGRDRELARLEGYITSSDTHPTLEGANGVGKTSLVAVAGFKLFKAWENGASQQAIIPLPEPFQLTPEVDISDFKKAVLFRVAQAFFDNHQILKERGFDVPDIDSVRAWLNSPILGGMTGGIGAAGYGASAGKTKLANTSEGFTEAGFVSTIKGWLKTCFRTNSSGAFLCVIDNLELLETSKSARALVEAARDEVLGIHGLRWVLCGARGIIRSAASSPRLQGVLADPQIIHPISENNVKPLIDARINTFSIDSDVVPPVDAIGFRHLYNVGNKNLRNAMKYSEDFSIWVSQNELPENASERFVLLETWMAETADQYLSDAVSVGRRAWQVFDRLVALGGSTSPSDFAEFGFNSNPAMSPHLRVLEEANLIESAVDDTDSRRRTISVTSAGWVVNYRRSGFSTIGSH